MEQIQNHRLVDSQPIWLKLVISEPDWLALTNPWLKEVIKSDPDFIFNIFMGNFALPLSSTCFGSSGWVLVDASINRLRCQSDQLSDWQLHSVRLKSCSVRHKSGIDGLSFSYSGLSPWDLCPLWAGVSILCINKAWLPPFWVSKSWIEELLLL